MPLTALDPLTRLAEDARVSAHLLAPGDELRPFVEMLGALPPEPDAWREVIEPWLGEARRGRGPALDAPGRAAVLGALGVAALRAAQDLPADERLAGVLTHAARWCFFMVRPDAA